MKWLFIALFLSAQLAQAAINTKDIDYKSGTDEMRGYVASPTGPGKRPAVLIVHDWMGLGEFTKKKAEELAKKGFVAMAVDIYGVGVRPQNVQQAGELASKYKDDRTLLRAHIRAAYDQVAAMPNVDPNKIVVMGYCFGGTTALELARSGAQLAGTASFHGGLSAPNAADAKKIKGWVLVMHGADDPFVPADEVKAFKQEMSEANVKMKFVSYPGAVHGFAIPSAGNDKSKGFAYNAAADKKSWKEFESKIKGLL